MDPIETIEISDTLRLRVYHDDSAGDCNPLAEWDHGIQFITFPGAGRTYRNYHDLETYNCPYDGVSLLDVPALDYFREGNYNDGGTMYRTLPSLRTWLDARSAAWVTVNRSGYDGTLHISTGDERDLEEDDAVAFISRDVYRRWHMVPDGKPMPKGYRDDATKALRAIIGEYNAWATGDVYGYVVERLEPPCPCCDAPEHWEPTDDSCWGFIGHDYAMSTFRDIAEHHEQE